MAAVTGALTMLMGAGFWLASGVDLDGALLERDMVGYFDQVAAAPGLVKANLSSWIVGVLLLGAAGTLMSGLPGNDRPAASLARYAYWIAVPMAVVAFVAMLSLVVVAPLFVVSDRLVIGYTVGWIGSRADWIATGLIVGAGPALLSFAGRNTWVPPWLSGWGLLAGAAGILTAFAIFTQGLTTYGFAVVPVGLGWTLAAGVVLLRHAHER